MSDAQVRLTTRKKNLLQQSTIGHTHTNGQLRHQDLQRVLCSLTGADGLWRCVAATASFNLSVGHLSLTAQSLHLPEHGTTAYLVDRTPRVVAVTRQASLSRFYHPCGQLNSIHSRAISHLPPLCNLTNKATFFLNPNHFGCLTLLYVPLSVSKSNKQTHY